LHTADPNNLKVDLHMHTTASDGSITIEELLEEIVDIKLDIFSVTEHDTIKNVERISAFAQMHKIRYIPGVELSATYEGRRMHILGYNFDFRNEKLIAFTNANTVLFRKEEDEGLDVLYPDPDFAIDVIRAAGGAPILAHVGAPFYDPDYKGLISRMSSKGIEGLECYHPQNSKEVSVYCVAECRRNRLMITGGSDYHGDCVPSRNLGMLELTLQDMDLRQISVVDP
jgi:3',5'-nucleoside bisphosphate phosphatase